ncbi:MAG: hypothetical protein ABI656_07675 [bacterium]
MHTTSSRSTRLLASVMASFVALATLGCTSLATRTQTSVPLELSFQTHATFFSSETHQPRTLDPQVFVRDPEARAGIGPQNIEHGAGLRPAFANESVSTPIYTARGEPLAPLTLGTWLAARGSVSIRPREGGASLSAVFSGLRPTGIYSLFQNHFDQKPVGFTPLDGTGTTNTFTADADGNARVFLVMPAMPTGANAVLLVYHSDREAHGMSRGMIGVNAHHQLIAKVP